MAGPIGVNIQHRLEAALRVTYYDKQLRMKAVAHDIYSKLEGLVNTEQKSIPLGSIIARVEGEMNKSNTGILPLKENLRDPATYGEQQQVGNEERARTKSATIYRNNLRHAVTNDGYGGRKLDRDWYGLIEQHIDDLADYAEAHYGLEIRQAILERFGETLVHGDTAGNCTRNWNRNMFVCGLDIASAPVAHSTNVATYTQNILADLRASGGGDIITPHVNQTLTSPNLSNASNWAYDRRLKKLKMPVPGGTGYVLTVSERQATYMGDPQWTNRNMGYIFTERSKLPEKVQNWPGVLGHYKDMLIVVDYRQPVIDITGTSEPLGLTAQYIWPTDEDERSRAQDTVVDTAFLLGPGAAINWYPEKIHNIKQLDDYGKIEGTGFALVRGVQVPHFVDNNDANPDQFTSAVLLARLPAYV